MNPLIERAKHIDIGIISLPFPGIYRHNVSIRGRALESGEPP
jgi:hypothetical protein